MFKNVDVIVALDETTDSAYRQVVNVVMYGISSDITRDLTVPPVPYLVKTEFLSSVNHETIARLVIQTLLDLSIELDRVKLFLSDNASYMKKAFKDILQPIFPAAFMSLAMHMC